MSDIVKRGIMAHAKWNGIAVQRLLAHFPHLEERVFILNQPDHLWPSSGMGMPKSTITEPMLFHAAKDHLARLGLLALEHISLICFDPSPDKQ